MSRATTPHKRARNKASYALFLAILSLTSAPNLIFAQSATGDDKDSLAKYDTNKNGRLDPGEGPSAPEIPQTEEEPVVLSPFEVVEEKDRSFMATNVGSATKLGLELKDMPAAYSVMTRELLDTLDVRNLQDATSWVTSGAVAAVDGTPNDTLSTPNRVFTQQRGKLNQTGQQRNFFLNAGIGDTYSAERIDFGRGPNALFFNFGDINNPFAGGTSVQTKTPRLETSIKDLTVSFGSWSNFRSTLDINQPLSKKLALRVNVLAQSSDGYRDNFDDRKGITLGLLYRLGKSTDIKVTGSFDNFKRSQRHASIFDSLSGWDGVTTTRGYISNAMMGTRGTGNAGAATAGTPMANGKVLSGQAEVQGLARLGTGYLVYIPGSGIMNFQNYATTRRGDETSYTPVYYNGQSFSRNDLWMRNVANGVFNGGFSSGTTRYISADNMLGLGGNAANGGTGLLYQPDLSSDRFDRAIAGSVALGGDFTGLPNKRKVIDAKRPVLDEDDADLYVSVTHKFSETLFASVAFDVNKMSARMYGAGFNNRLRYAYIDVNELLPDGQANPHLGDVYSDDVTPQYRDYKVKNIGVRPSVNYILDTKKYGYYTFNLGAAVSRREITDWFYALSLANTPDARQWNGTGTLLKVREYWSNPIAPFEGIGTQSFYNATFDANNVRTGSTTTQVTPRYTLTGGGTLPDYTEESMGAAFALSGRYFYSDKLADERLVITGGVGLNNMKTSKRELLNRADMPANWDGNQKIYKPDAPADWTTLTYLTRNTSGVPTSSTPRVAVTRPRAAATADPIGSLTPRTPGYEMERFRDDYNQPSRDENVTNFSTGFVYRPYRWVDAKANFSNSYIPPTVGWLDLEGLPAKVTKAYGYDARIGLTPFGSRFVLNSGWFYNYSENQRTNSPIMGNVNALYATRDYTDTTVGNRNSLGVPDLVSGTNTDYTTSVNTGVEFEIVGRIMPGLEITGSYARFRTKEMDRFTDTPGYYNSRRDLFLDLLRRAGGTVNSNGFAIADGSLGITDSNQIANQNNAVNAYNGINTTYTTNLIDKVGEGIYGGWAETANVFVRYEFRSGPLKRLRLGVGGNWKSAVYLGNGNDASSHKTDFVPNPNYNPNAAFNNTVGVIGPDGRYTYKNANGTPTGYNAPWMPNPEINQLLISEYQATSPSLLNSIFTIGYSHKLNTGIKFLNGKEIVYNLVVNNFLNRQKIERVNYASRSPGGDYVNNQNLRTAAPGTISGYQEPINFVFTTTVKF